ncbi:MAG: MerR family transcriptional regulator [Gemmatimonadetes bacterium]|nr:MerR family transcriptional regulator [Gemmatimonadota bacterium]
MLRVWERRYQVVAPERSAGGQRLYSDADIERLRLLGTATQAGRNISQLVALPNDQLLDLIRADQEAERRTRPAGVGLVSGVMAEEGDLAVARLMEAVEALDGPALEGGLRQAVATFGMHGAIDAVIHPLLVEIGERWHDGDLPPQHEHFATATVRRVLDGLVHELSVGAATRPRILVATPAGQRHELGALLVAATAAALGWRVTYLGHRPPRERHRRRGGDGGCAGSGALGGVSHRRCPAGGGPAPAGDATAGRAHAAPWRERGGGVPGVPAVVHGGHLRGSRHAADDAAAARGAVTRACDGR